MVFWSVLCLISHTLSRVSNVCSTPRSTVATLSTPQTSGLSPFPAACTLPLSVCILPLHKLATTLWINAINIGIGIAILSFQNQGTDTTLVFSSLGIPYLTISVLLNVLLTLMIIIRIVLYDRKLRAAPRSPVAVGISGLFKAASTMLIESCALFAVSSLVVVGSLVEAADHSRGAVATVDFSFPILAEIQVRAFPRPQYPGQLSDVTDTGDCSTTHHSTSRQRERVDERSYHYWTHQFVQR